jgi:hypothetical protein
MASTIKCKACHSQNSKYSKLCKACGVALYKDVSYKLAFGVTLILDVLFSIMYIFAVVLFIKQYNVRGFSQFLTFLPEIYSFGYFIIIIFFVISAIIRIVFIVNVFSFKSELPYHIRRVSMFVECVTMFPVQTIFAIYFYNTATNINRRLNN